MIQVSFPVPGDKIKAEADRVREHINGLHAEIKVAAEVLKLIQKSCRHVGQKVGYNERDGSWANPCPTCGYSY